MPVYWLVVGCQYPEGMAIQHLRRRSVLRCVIPARPGQAHITADMGDDLHGKPMIRVRARMDDLRRLDCRCLAGSLCGGRNRQGLSARPVPPCFSPPRPWSGRRSLDMVLDSICRIRSLVTP